MLWRSRPPGKAVRLAGIKVVRKGLQSGKNKSLKRANNMLSFLIVIPVINCQKKPKGEEAELQISQEENKMKTLKHRFILLSIMIVGAFCLNFILPTALLAELRISNEIRLDSDSNQQNGNISVDKLFMKSTDNKGNAFAAWRRETGVLGGNTAYRIHFNRSRDYGHTWLKHDLQISVDDPKPQGEGAKAMNFAMCHDNKGNLYLLWTTSDRSLHFRRSADYGMTWSKAAILNGFYDLLYDYNKAPGIACDSKNRVYVLWVAWDGYMYFTYSQDGGTTWQEKVTLGPQGKVIDAQIDCDEKGNVLVSWVDGREVVIPEKGITHLNTIRNITIKLKQNNTPEIQQVR